MKNGIVLGGHEQTENGLIRIETINDMLAFSMRIGGSTVHT